MFTQLNINAGLAFGAFAIALFCFISSLRKNLSRVQHATYLIICLSCLVCPLTSIAEEVFITFGKDGDGLLWLFMGSEVIFFVFHSFLAPSFGLYVLSLNGTLVGRKKRIWFIYWIPVMLVEIANIANIFFPRDARPLYTATVGEAGNYVYQRGDFMFIFYIVAGLYVLLSLFAFIRNIRALNAKKIISLLSFYAATLAGVVIQFLWKDIKFEAFFESFSILGLLILLESDTGIINNNTGLYNENAFYNDNATAMAAKRKYTIITLQSPDYFQYLEMLGQTNYNGIELLVARYLTSIVKSQYVYHLSNGAYGIMLYEEKESDVDMIVQMIQHRFEEPFGYGAIEASPRWTITVAKVPNDIEDPSQLHYLFAGKNGGFEQKVIIRDSLSLRFIKRRSKIEGAIARGVSKENALKIYDEMSEFAKYAFNKSHACAYSVVAYRTAYLKCHYPREYLSALITSVLDSEGKVASYIAEVGKQGIRVLPPSVNDSGIDFTVEGKDVRFGLLAIKNIGKNVLSRILEEREKNGKYKSFEDFLSRTCDFDVYEKVVENLIKSGAFDCFGKKRSQLLQVYSAAMKSLSKQRSSDVKGQIDLFSQLSGEETPGKLVIDWPDVEELPYNE
ncbi:MAG: hypothetical protein IKX82_00805, partial [Bacilli bacterium]|nr:hypothetical protein [Bacilli bacterium]